MLTGQIGVPVMGSTVATEVCLFRTTGSEARVEEADWDALGRGCY